MTSGWRPIGEIGKSTSNLVAVAGPQGVYLAERKVAAMIRGNWFLFHELAPLPKRLNYVLPPDAYEVQDTGEPAENGREE